MSDKSVQIQGGTSLFTLLTVLFVGLKLGHVITWSWWWVLSPLWLPTVSILGFILVIAILAGLVSLIP